MKLINYVRSVVKDSEAAARGDFRAVGTEVEHAVLSSDGGVFSDGR